MASVLCSANGRFDLSSNEFHRKATPHDAYQHEEICKANNRFLEEGRNLRARVALRFAWYDFVRVHRWLHRTLATLALTDGPGSFEELLESVAREQAE